MSGLVWLAILALCGLGGLWWIVADGRRIDPQVQPEQARCVCGAYRVGPLTLIDPAGRRHQQDHCR